ncbi:hypothetical protein D9758_015438 [Tetrapyrgos nigripes]|uniref:Uncharacterized protein n=1 Tax=Tetrapyrgos nigripes TaxID=182062 RepID=A0A8H5CKW5_9AGAR|nr:hypothetical protein D9758_015438 [Tetrapyrgos nigripes]
MRKRGQVGNGAIEKKDGWIVQDSRTTKGHDVPTSPIPLSIHRTTLCSSSSKPAFTLTILSILSRFRLGRSSTALPLRLQCRSWSLVPISIWVTRSDIPLASISSIINRQSKPSSRTSPHLYDGRR